MDFNKSNKRLRIRICRVHEVYPDIKKPWLFPVRRARDKILADITVDETAIDKYAVYTRATDTEDDKKRARKTPPGTQLSMDRYKTELEVP